MKTAHPILLVLLTSLSTISNFEFTFDPIDVIIPCHEKDKRTLDLVIKGIREHLNVRKVIVISEKPINDLAEWFDERNFPFTKEDIAYEIFQNERKAYTFLHSPKTRIGWIYQQMIKFYSLFIIPNISSNMLCIDADTIFLKPVVFQDKETGAGLYAVSNEHNEAYFVHNAKVIPGWKKMFPLHSGIAHHMLFQRSIMESLYDEIVAIHNEEPWKVFCHLIDHNELYRSCMSIDYELYFNYVFAHSAQVKLRQLHWSSIPLREFNNHKNSGYDYLSCHTYMK